MQRTTLQILAVLIGLSSLAPAAQAGERDRTRDSMNVELLGRAVVLSINGELGLSKRVAVSAGFFPYLAREEKSVVVPLHVSWLSHSDRGLYLSGGVTYVNDHDSEVTSTLTYGFQVPIRRAYVRLTFTYFDGNFSNEQNPGEWDLPNPWPGLAIGGRF